jgi:hypothetical protein
MNESQLAEAFARLGRAAFEFERWSLELEAAQFAVKEAAGSCLMSLTGADGPAIAKNEKALARPLPLSSAERAEFVNGGIYHGVYASVARKLGRTRHCVSDIGRGAHQSPRILAAIRAEMALVDAEMGR